MNENLESSPPPRSRSLPPPDPRTRLGGDASQAGRGGFFSRLPESGLRPGSAGLGVLVAALVMITGTIVVAAFDPELESTAAREAAQAVVALSLLGTAIGFALHAHGGRLREALASLGVRAGPLWPTIGLAVLAWAIYLIVAAPLSLLLQPEQEDIARELGADLESFWGVFVAGLLIVVAAPLSEELFFRGFIYGALRSRLPIWIAILISSAVWGVLHLSGGNLGVAIQLTIFGVLLALLYERSGNLLAPILAHVLNNAIAFALLVSDVT